MTGVVGNGARRAYRLFLVRWRIINGGVAQLGEQLPCTQQVAGSMPVTSTKFCEAVSLSRLQFATVTRSGLVVERPLLCRWIQKPWKPGY